jgi:hypothetical protein
MTPVEEVLRELARESGRVLGELGVRPGDQKWIREHAETIASLAGRGPSFRGRDLLRRLRLGFRRG